MIPTSNQNEGLVRIPTTSPNGEKFVKAQTGKNGANSFTPLPSTQNNQNITQVGLETMASPIEQTQTESSENLRGQYDAAKNELKKALDAAKPSPKSPSKPESEHSRLDDDFSYNHILGDHVAPKNKHKRLDPEISDTAAIQPKKAKGDNANNLKDAIIPNAEKLLKSLEFYEKLPAVIGDKLIARKIKEMELRTEQLKNPEKYEWSFFDRLRATPAEIKARISEIARNIFAPIQKRIEAHGERIDKMRNDFKSNLKELNARVANARAADTLSPEQKKALENAEKLLDRLPVRGKESKEFIANLSYKELLNIQEALKQLENVLPETKASPAKAEVKETSQSSVTAESQTKIAEGEVFSAAMPKHLVDIMSSAQKEFEKLDKQIRQLEEQLRVTKSPEEKSKIRGQILELKAQAKEAENQMKLRPHLMEVIDGKVAMVPNIPINTENRVSDQVPLNVPFNNYGLKPDPGTVIKFKRLPADSPEPAIQENVIKGEGKIIAKPVNGYEVTLTIGGVERTLKCPDYAIRIANASDPENVMTPQKVAGVKEESEFSFLVEEGMQIYSSDKAQINCDVGLVTENANGAQVMTFCDGCGWGQQSQNAARTGSSVAQKYVSEGLSGARTLQDVARLMLNGIKEAHREISESENIRDTTFNQVVTVDGYAVIATVGDPKTFIIRNGKAIDITAGGRGNLHDASDSGGRIGVDSQGESTADFHNLGLHVVKLQPGDLIMVCSDGIHDNLDPETTGLTVAEAAKFCGMGMESVPEGDWKTADQRKIGLLKKEYMEKKVAEVVSGADNPVEALQQHTSSVTQDLKLGLMQGKKPVDGDYTRFRGKPDHGGVIAMKYNPQATPISVAQTEGAKKANERRKISSTPPNKPLPNLPGAQTTVDNPVEAKTEATETNQAPKLSLEAQKLADTLIKFKGQDKDANERATRNLHEIVVDRLSGKLDRKDVPYFSSEAVRHFILGTDSAHPKDNEMVEKKEMMARRAAVYKLANQVYIDATGKKPLEEELKNFAIELVRQAGRVFGAGDASSVLHENNSKAFNILDDTFQTAIREEAQANPMLY